MQITNEGVFINTSMKNYIVSSEISQKIGISQVIKKNDSFFMKL